MTTPIQRAFLSNSNDANFLISERRRLKVHLRRELRKYMRRYQHRVAEWNINWEDELMFLWGDCWWTAGSRSLRRCTQKRLWQEFEAKLYGNDIPPFIMSLSPKDRMRRDKARAAGRI